MKMFLFVCLFAMIYLLLVVAKENQLLRKINHYVAQKNEKYYDRFLQYYEKSQKVKLKEKWNYFHHVYLLLERCEWQRSLFVNPITILLLGILCVNVAYVIAFSIFQIIALAVLISLPFFFTPFVILHWMAERKERKLEKVFLNFLLQLKNHTQIHNDIVMAMKEVKTAEPLQGYIQTFLIEISSGVKMEKAIANLKEKINIGQIKMFFTNVEHCYLYGGSFSELIQKSYQMIREIQTEKVRRQEETKSARWVLFVLIALDFIVYISYIQSNRDNYLIMQKSIIGNMILYWNFLSIWLLVLLSMKVKKLDY